MTRLQDKYNNEISTGLKDQFEYKNIHQIPRLDKIVVSMGVGKAVENKAAIDAAVKDMAKITGQKPVVRTAKGSISNFRLREGNPVGCMTTLRNERMYEFMDRLVSVVLPRIRDFRGVKDNFDGRGNFSLGLNEQTLFPEIQLDQIEFTQGMNITFVTSARTDEEGRALLSGFGVPFRRKSSEN
ncbi:MAG TPA: 50S ribosomal protein L5 [Planctomycetes bacterium]|jgi:large subunit ribosomal protein L5|nr:50S ribosomal protein L5 [Planctomycetota bacterium]